MKYHIKTYGCQMNESDSERVASSLEKKGYQATQPEKADLLIINVCSVRQSAINRVYGLIRNYRKLNGKIILTGCLLKTDRKKFEKIVDEIWPQTKLNIEPKCQKNNLAFLPIMTGCNNFCTYCAVPYTRGRERSRLASEIKKDFKSLIKKGHKEITLLGQNVNSYQSKGKIKDFPDLLKDLTEIEGDFQIKFLTSHPKDMSDKLINLIAENLKTSKEIHLPVQAGDNTILKKMNRSYTVGHYKKLIKKIKKKIPNVILTTDIIVGFPGETEKQFKNTVKLIKEVDFEQIFVSRYSPRTGTTAAQLEDDVSHQDKKRRWRAVNQFNK